MVSLFVSLLFPFLALLVIVVFSYWFFIIRRRGPDFSNTPLRSSYDYVIVGAGNSGCVVAARLVEAGLSVLVLEAGGEDGAFNLKAPLAAYETQKTEVDWQFTTVPQKEMEGRTSHWPRGKVLGGCTNLNFMLAVRGSAAEYDDWESKHGCRGWSYKALLPYFKRLESYVARTKHSSDNDSRGAHGPLYIAEAAEPLRGASLFVEASAELGYRVNYDYNAGSPEGASLAQLTIKHGQRQSSAMAYLHPARAKHPDLLHIRTRAHVVSLNHQDRTVTFMSGSSRVVVKASREIVLCAGAVGTPHLLLSSGIGDTNHLKAVGVAPKIHLPGVGRNLQDHLFVPVAFSCDEPIGIRKVDVGVRDLWRYFTSGTGALSSQGLEAMSFLRTQPMMTFPDVQLHCVTAGGGEKKGDENKNARNMGLKVTTFPRDMPAHLLYIMPTLLHPRSKGSVRLQSNDPFAPPIIDPGYLTDERDMKTLMRGIEEARRVANTQAFKRVGVREYRSFFVDEALEMGTPEYDEALVRSSAITVYHPTGTCKMGHAYDPLSVCDEFGRVLKVDGLRVADLSLCPEIPGANTQLPSYVIGEKIADHLIADALLYHSPSKSK